MGHAVIGGSLVIVAALACGGNRAPGDSPGDPAAALAPATAAAAVGEPAGPEAAQHLLLVVRASDHGLEVVSTRVVPVPLPLDRAPRPAAVDAWHIELLDAAGASMVATELSPPDVVRGELAGSGGAIEAHRSTAATTEFLVRFPVIPGASSIAISTGATRGARTARRDIGRAPLPPVAATDIVESLIANGPIADRLNVAVLGDAYTSSAADQAKLTSDAQNMLTGLFSSSPYQTYRGLFNVKLIHTVSSSSVVPTNGGASRATALGCHFDCAGVARQLCCDGGSEGSVAAVTAANVPEATVSIVVVNDATVAGSGGPFVTITASYDVIDVLRHELGHQIAGLADEYSDPYPAYPPCDPATDCPEPNATLYPQRPGKWGQWVSPDVCVPTAANTEGVGYFEGCRYKTTGVYKPASNPVCLMHSLGFDFCPVCEEALSLAMWSHARAVDSATPDPTAAVETAGCAQQSFAIAVAANAGQLAITWSIDGVPQPAATTAIASFDANLVTPGTHQVVAIVHDTNPAIRADPKQLTTTTTTWTWQTSCPSGMPIDAGMVVPPDAPPPDGPPGACTIGDTTHPAGMTPAGGCGVARGGGPGALIAMILAAATVIRRRGRHSDRYSSIGMPYRRGHSCDRDT